MLAKKSLQVAVARLPDSETIRSPKRSNVSVLH